jgi:hypothetical protein
MDEWSEHDIDVIYRAAHGYYMLVGPSGRVFAWRNASTDVFEPASKADAAAVYELIDVGDLILGETVQACCYDSNHHETYTEIATTITAHTAHRK